MTTRTAFDIAFAVILGVIPLLYCVLSFSWILKIISKVSAIKGLLLACLLFGACFVVFQFISIIPLDVGNIADRLDFSLTYSWIGVLNYVLVGTDLENWFPESVWVIEVVYILFFMLIGLVTVAGAKFWKTLTPIRYVGCSLLVLCFCVYTFGIFFWMVTGLYM